MFTWTAIEKMAEQSAGVRTFGILPMLSRHILGYLLGGIAFLFVLELRWGTMGEILSIEMR